MKNNELIAGAGGGGSGGGAGGPNVARDNLDSVQYARLLELISEGEIEGFPSARSYTKGTTSYDNAALKDIFFNNVPVLREGADVTNPSDSDFNYKGIYTYLRYGTQAQDWIRGFRASETAFSVGTVVSFASSVTRTITDTTVDAVRITFSVPQLQFFKENGDVTGTQVNFRIELSYDGGAFSTANGGLASSDSRLQFKGRTADLYQRAVVIDFTQSFSSSVAVRIVRETADAGTGDPENSTRVDEISWASYAEIRYSKLRYPNSAVFELVLPAEQFSAVPQRAYRIRGIKVQIPSNARPAIGPNGRGGLIYKDEPWDGTFTQSTDGGQHLRRNPVDFRPCLDPVGSVDKQSLRIWRSYRYFKA